MPDISDLIEEAAEQEALLRFPDTSIRPISEFDGTKWAVLRKGTESIFGCRRDGKWCSMFGGGYYHKEGFEQTQFKIVPDEPLVAYAH